jgi:hypothetical protein
MKFQDIELEFKDDVFVVPANKVMKLYRSVSPLAKMEYLAKPEVIIADEPWLFTDAYLKALSFGESDIEQPTEDEVLIWAQDENIQTMLDGLLKIKFLFQQPENFTKKTGVPKAKKKRATKKK